MAERILKKRAFSGTQGEGRSKREEDHAAVARKAASSGIVLLKNQGNILPLGQGEKIAIYGVGASRTIKGGIGSGDVNERKTISIYEGLKAAGFLISNEKWVRDYDVCYQEAREEWRDKILAASSGKMDVAHDFFGIYTSNPFVLPQGAPFEKTEAKVAIYVLSRIAGEAADRFAKEGDYYLLPNEKKMLADICTHHERVIIVLNTGGQVDLSFMDEHENIHGLLQVSQPGMEGGHAVADIISGKENPSGKLTNVWAYKYEDYPNSENFSHNNGNVEQERYEEGIYVGYRYFDSYNIPVRYGFGFGLSYTEFSIDTKGISKMVEAGMAQIQIAVEITNNGKQKGKEVVQCYASCPYGVLEKEHRRLIAFSKTKELSPGETQKILLKISAEQLASYDESRSEWILEEGSYGIWIGNNLEFSKLNAVVDLDARVTLTRAVKICPLQETITEFHVEDATRRDRYENWKLLASKEALPTIALLETEFSDKIIAYKKNSELVKADAKAFVDMLSEEELIKLAVGNPNKGQGGNLGSAGIVVPGSAGETHDCLVDRGLANVVLADGPAGLRLMKYYYVREGKIVSMPFQFSLEGGIFCPEAEGMKGERYYQYCTAMPIGTLLAQTWDIELLAKVGEVIGLEMELFGVTLWLAPGMNIHRNPLCGRNFEYYSEDPFLTGKVAAAVVKGVQKISGCGATIKHMACNNQEENRMHSNSILSERTLREIYLKGFEIAIKDSQPMAIMTSYNCINGVHAANNYDLCTEVVRNEWGFQGAIMTDWVTTEQDDSCTAAGCIRAGNDLIMPGCIGDYESIRNELAKGTLDREELKACVSRLVSVIWQSNQYER